MLRLIRPQGQAVRSLPRLTFPVFQKPIRCSRISGVPRNTASLRVIQPVSKPYSTQATPPPPPPPPPLKPKRSRLYRAGRALLVIVSVPVAGTLSWYAYHQLANDERSVLRGERPNLVVGGPKNLIVAHPLKVEEIHQNDPRQRLVILGSGWGVSDCFQGAGLQKHLMGLVC